MSILGQTVKRREEASRTYELDGLPPIVEYVRGSYRQSGQVNVRMSVDRVTFSWLDGVFRNACVEGRRLKTSGQPGLVHGRRHFGARWFREEELRAEVPDWLLELARTTPEPSMLEYQTQQDQERRKREERRASQ